MYSLCDRQIVTLVAKKRPNASGLARAFDDYMDEITDWVCTDVRAGKGNLQDFICILNPDETKPEIDEAIRKRIKLYNFNPQ